MIKSYYKSIKKKQVSEYFKCIIENRFDDMESLFNNRITLYDGKAVISGKKNLINFTKRIFNNKQFKIYNQIILDEKKGDIVISRFDLKLNKIKLKIVDEFWFDKKNKILKIRVYKF